MSPNHRPIIAFLLALCLLAQGMVLSANGCAVLADGGLDHHDGMIAHAVVFGADQGHSGDGTPSSAHCCHCYHVTGFFPLPRQSPTLAHLLDEGRIPADLQHPAYAGPTLLVELRPPIA
ncbi:MAG: hypothetical protein KJ558_06010 [Gammaproteobacteria bacterium]|nr:hypothetical protein [Gammaproteobacteria bacterium]MBU1654372.1 hypothetical protein [Gammaproteobacteria bacterium]MBU1961999.1 hypothetical protein [Gammaproteobacteria bacterium]